MSKIITARIALDSTSGLDTFASPLLVGPGEKRAYRLLSFGVSGIITGSSGADGVFVAIQDGEIEPTLLDVVETGRAQRFVNGDAMFLEELSILWSLGLPATGGGQSGFVSSQKNWSPGFVTANALTILTAVRFVNLKRFMVHLEYDQIAVSPREWTELKHRSSVVDLLSTIDT